MVFSEERRVEQGGGLRPGPSGYASEVMRFLLQIH